MWRVFHETTPVITSLMRWGLPPVGLSHVANRVTVFPPQTLSTTYLMKGRNDFLKGESPRKLSLDKKNNEQRVGFLQCKKKISKSKIILLSKEIVQDPNVLFSICRLIDLKLLKIASPYSDDWWERHYNSPYYYFHESQDIILYIGNSFKRKSVPLLF